MIKIHRDARMGLTLSLKIIENIKVIEYQKNPPTKIETEK